MTTNRLFLTGIRASGRHGASPGEKDDPQEFVVDLDVEVRVSGDALDNTADYRKLIEVTREVVANESFDLLETIANAVASAVAHMPGVVRTTAIVHKPAAARSSDLQGIAAAATVDGEA